MPPPDCQKPPILHTTSSHASLWGTISSCTNTHVRPRTQSSALDAVWWLHLGHDTTPRALKQWIKPEIRDSVPCFPPFIDWATLAAEIGASTDDLRAGKFVVKLPHMDEPAPITSPCKLFELVETLHEAAKSRPIFCCMSPPPICLVCTTEQASKFASCGWQNAVLSTALQGEEDSPADAGPETDVDLSPGIPIQVSEAYANDEMDGNETETDHNEDWLHGKVNDDAEGQQAEEDRARHLLGMVDTSNAGMQQQHWMEACQFFLHDPQQTDAGVHLPGFAIRSRNYQMVDVYKMLMPCRSRTQNGTLNSSEPGMGKTLECLLAASTIALAHLCAKHCQTHPEAHASISDNRQCSSEGFFGIECYCQSRSLTRAIVKNLACAPQLVIAPSHLTEQWADERQKLLTPNVVLCGGQFTLDEPLLLLARNKKGGGIEPVLSGGQTTSITLQQLMPMMEISGLVPSPHAIQAAADSMYKDGIIDKNTKNRWKSRKTNDEKTFACTLQQARLLREYSDNANDTFHVEYNYNAFYEESGAILSRVVLVYSTTAVSQSILDKTFTSATKIIKRRGKGANCQVTISRCFAPSSIYYDEWTEAKGENTHMLKVLRDLCQVQNTDGRHRPLMTLLSGTPMARGPQDVSAVLPLILTDPNIHKTITNLTNAFKNASIPSNTTEGVVALQEWKTQATELFAGCMFSRDFGAPFLNGFIPDTRPQLSVYPPTFCPVSAAHQEAFQHLRDDISKVMSEKAKETTRLTFQQLTKSSRFRFLLLCSTIPGILSLDRTLWDTIALPSDDDSKQQLIDESIRLMKCEQLDRLEYIIKTCESNNSGLVLSLFPDGARIAYAWLKHRLGERFQVHLFTSKQAPNKRREEIQRLTKQAENDPGCRLVIVSTYQLMSFGIDGFQHFASYLVKLGEPWSINHTKQSQRRIHRHGQKKTPTHYSIHGAERSLDWELYQRNNKNSALLDSNTILGSIRSNPEVITVD